MSITFTSTRVGTSADYMRYVYNDVQGLQKTDRYMDSALLDFALVPVDAAYVHLDRGAYIVVDSTTYPKWFTGYITNEAEASYLGKDVSGNPVFGYKYQATSDEYIISMKPIGVVQPYLNMNMGVIIKSLVTRMVGATLFDVTNVQDGPVIAQYVVTPDQLFQNVVKDLCDQAGYMFYGNDHKLYFRPQDDTGLGSITIDGHDQHFTPSRLTIRPSQTPIVNDCTVLGDLEPQAYMHEYFVGTGLESDFPLLAGVWGADTALLVEDTFSNSAIDPTIWTIYRGGAVEAGDSLLTVFNNYLNVLGGTADGTYGLWIQGVSAIPMESRLRFTHGEFDFVNSGNGYLGCVWSQAPNAALTGCLYGLKASGLTLNPIVAGVVDSSQFVTVSTSMRYVIRTVVEFSKAVRVPNQFTYLDSSGITQTVTSLAVPDIATWQTLISEVDPNSGTLTNQWAFKNTSTLNGTTDTYAIYTPIMSDTLNLTVGNISVSIPINCTLETSTAIPLVNGGFDDWLDGTHPSGWLSPINCTIEPTFPEAGNALRLNGSSASLSQDVSMLLQPNVGYNVTFQVSNFYGAATGTLTIAISGTGITTQSFTLNVATIVYNAWYSTVQGRLFNPIPAIPSDALLTISFSGSPIVVLDSLTIQSDYIHQLVGPNEMNAMDGLAPVATITSGNMNSQTKSTYTGAPQYNPGQDQLVFFKNSVTLTSNVPPENQIFRVSYRAAGSAVGRVKSGTSITTEASLWGDDGVRSIVRTDLQPRPRISSECELAAQMIVSENGFQHYEGDYTQFNPYFASEPKSGMPIKFTNLPGIPFLTAEEINEVQTTALANKPTELFQHQLTFGKPDHIRRLLAKFETPIDAYQQNPVSPYADPSFVDITTIGTNYIEDVVKPVLMNWDERFIYMDMGQNLSSDATNFEVRYTDSGFGQGNGKNLAVRQTGRLFTIQRNARGRVFFIRQVGAGGITSRYSAGVNIAFPVISSNHYIRDWTCHTIDTSSPLVTGTDLSQNRFRVTLDAGEQVTLDDWTSTVKTTPTSGQLVFDMLRSQDFGVTWESLFTTTQRPTIPVNKNTAEGNAFQVRFLQKDDMLRYDEVTADGVGGGLEIILRGRVFTIGDAPVGSFTGTGTGGLGPPVGNSSSPGTVTQGIAAEYLLREAGGTVSHDTSGLLRDGNFVPSHQPSWDAGGLGLDFTSNNQAVLLPNATLGIDNSSVRDFTEEVWFKPTAAGYVTEFGANDLALQVTSTGYTVYINGSAVLTASGSPFGSWHQVVVTRSGSTLTLYVNDVSTATATVTTATLALGTSGTKFLGGDTTSTYPTALMTLGEARFYARALTSTEVGTNWTARRATYGL